MAGQERSRFGRGSGGPLPGSKYSRDLLRTYTDDQAPLAYNPAPRRSSPQQGYWIDLPNGAKEWVSPGDHKWIKKKK